MALSARRTRLGLLAWVSVAALACLTVYLFLARWFWPAEILCHFRPLVAALALLAALAALGVRLRAQSLALGALALICAWPTLALCVPDGGENPAGPTLRVATANLLWGSESSAGLARWLEEEAPDVAFLWEVDPTRAAQLETLRERGYPYQLYSPPREEWHASTFGRAVISRLPLLEPAQHAPGSILDVHVQFGGRRLRLLGVHTPRPGRAWRTKSRNEVLDTVAALASESADVVVLGDLNVTECSATFPRLLAAGRLADTRAGRGPMGSWSVPMPMARWDLPLHLPLDHVLIGASLATLDRRLGPDIGSDHLPVVADLAWRQAARTTASR